MESRRRWCHQHLWCRSLPEKWMGSISIETTSTKPCSTRRKLNSRAKIRWPWSSWSLGMKEKYQGLAPPSKIVSLSSSKSSTGASFITSCDDDDALRGMSLESRVAIHQIVHGPSLVSGNTFPRPTDLRKMLLETDDDASGGDVAAPPRPSRVRSFSERPARTVVRRSLQMRRSVPRESEVVPVYDYSHKRTSGDGGGGVLLKHFASEPEHLWNERDADDDDDDDDDNDEVNYDGNDYVNDEDGYGDDEDDGEEGNSNDAGSGEFARGTLGDDKFYETVSLEAMMMNWDPFNADRRNGDDKNDAARKNYTTPEAASWAQYYDENDFLMRPRPRVPKLTRKTVLPEPRPLHAIPEPVPQAKWPPEFKRVLEHPTLTARAPQTSETFSLTSSAERKASLEGIIPFEPVVVYNSTVGDVQAPSDAGSSRLMEFDPPLSFESRFECGNLAQATRVGLHHYELQVRKDLNTKGHTQWYYFRIRGMMPGILYRIDITNFMKPTSLYNNGMRPLMYSEHVAETRGVGWHRVGKQISYTKNNTYSDEEHTIPLHTLSFVLTFEVANDTVFLAHCFPYSYTDLQQDIQRLKADPFRSTIFRHTVLARSLVGNNIDLITVTSPASRPEELARRRGIVFSARVHPGETNSSLMMRGLLMFLTSDTTEARDLRDNFVIKVVPMVNPDGVIIGNYRCNILGYDLNRYWRPVSIDWARENTPEVLALKEMVQRVTATRTVELFCDLHGHNRKHGIFIYGCHNDDDDSELTPMCDANGGGGETTTTTRKYRERVFPLMLSRNAEDLFSFRRCQFKIQRSKEGTGRVTVRRTFGVLNSFTLEASFCGADTSSTGGFHYSIDDLERMGCSIGRTVCEYFGALGSRAESVHREILRGFAGGDRVYHPEASESSETTSNDEVLRIKNPRRKRQTKKRSKSQSAGGGGTPEFGSRSTLIERQKQLLLQQQRESERIRKEKARAQQQQQAAARSKRTRPTTPVRLQPKNPVLVDLSLPEQLSGSATTPPQPLQQLGGPIYKTLTHNNSANDGLRGSSGSGSGGGSIDAVVHPQTTTARPLGRRPSSASAGPRTRPTGGSVSSVTGGAGKGGFGAQRARLTPSSTSLLNKAADASGRSPIMVEGLRKKESVASVVPYEYSAESLLRMLMTNPPSSNSKKY